MYIFVAGSLVGKNSEKTLGMNFSIKYICMNFFAVRHHKVSCLPGSSVPFDIS